MNRIVSILWILCFLSIYHGYAFPDSLKGDAAVVNGESISQKELLKVLECCYGKEEAEDLNVKVMSAVLEEMIIFKVIEQRLAKLSISYTAAEYTSTLEIYEEPFFIYYKAWGYQNPMSFQEAVKEIMKHAPPSSDTKWQSDFEEAWKKIFFDKELKKHLRKEVYQKYHLDYNVFREKVKLLTKFQKHVLNNITKSEIEEFATKEKFALEGGMVHVDHILLLTIDRITEKTFSDKENAETLRRMQQISQEMKPDLSNFAEIARKYSQDEITKYKQGKIGWVPRWSPSTLYGGFLVHLGWIPHWTTFVSEIVDQAYQIPEKKLSQPIKTNLGYHLLVVSERKPGKPLSQEELTKKAKERLSIQKMDAMLRLWLQESKIERKL